MPNPRQRPRPVSPGFGIGALIGIVVALWWRWVRAALGGAALALGVLGAVGMAVGLRLHGDRLAVLLTMSGQLGLAGAVLGVVVWSRRAGRPQWLGRRWWPLYVGGGLVVGALVPVGIIGMDTAGALLLAFFGGMLGLTWALVRHALRASSPPSPARFFELTGTYPYDPNP